MTREEFTQRALLMVIGKRLGPDRFYDVVDSESDNLDFEVECIVAFRDEVMGPEFCEREANPPFVISRLKAAIETMGPGEAIPLEEPD